MVCKGSLIGHKIENWPFYLALLQSAMPFIFVMLYWDARKLLV